FLILTGVKQARLLYTVLAASAAVLSAAYMLWMYQRVFLGETPEHNRNMPDLNAREKAILIPAVALMVLMGVFSPYFLRRMEPSASALLGKSGGTEIHVIRRAPQHSTIATGSPAALPAVRDASAAIAGQAARVPDA